jgi:hypothetical protein
VSLTEFERETIINFNDGEDVAYVYSAQRTVITRLRNNPAATLVEEGVHEGSVWARFTMPSAFVTFRTRNREGRELTEAERAARIATLQAIRQRRIGPRTVPSIAPPVAVRALPTALKFPGL